MVAEKLRSWGIAPCLGVLIASCASSPSTEFFALVPVEAHARAASAVSGPLAPQPTPDQGAAPAAPGAAAPPADTPVRVAAVHIAPALDRLQIVRESAPGRIEIASRQRWDAPLDEMLRTVLTQDLLRRLPGRRVLLPQQPAPAATQEIVLDVLHFAADAAGTVRLSGSWTLLKSGTDAPVSSERVELTDTASPNDYAGQALAMSRLVGQLADAIAARLGG